MTPVKILVDSRWAGDTGIGRLYREVMHYKPDGVNCNFVKSRMKPGNPFTPLMLAYEIQKSNSEIFYSPSFMPPMYSRVPYIITVHDLMHLFYYSSMHRVYYKQVIARLAKGAKKIITVSNFSKNQLIELLGIPEDLIAVIYNGVDESFFTNVKPYICDRPYFLYVGNRRRNKNILAMLEAFARAAIPEEFIFLMSGNVDSELKLHLKNLKIAKRVRFLGYIEEEELPKLYKGAFATVFVSLMEGFGLPLIESMATGTPVLTSNESSLPEIAGDAAHCVNPHSVGEIASGMEKLVEDSGLYGELAEKGIKRASSFTWKSTSLKTWQTILDEECSKTF